MNTILPLVQAAVQVGDIAVVKRLFQKVLGDFENVSNWSRLNLERSSWLKEAERVSISQRYEQDLQLSDSEGYDPLQQATHDSIQLIFEFILATRPRFAAVIQRAKKWERVETPNFSSESSTSQGTIPEAAPEGAHSGDMESLPACDPSEIIAYVDRKSVV